MLRLRLVHPCDFTHSFSRQFFAHPELSAEASDHASGNQGFRDQIAALQWIKHNIAAFGGDPDRITIAGESSGGDSVAALTISPSLATGHPQLGNAQCEPRATGH